jgi:hypothetical protein
MMKEEYEVDGTVGSLLYFSLLTRNMEVAKYVLSHGGSGAESSSLCFVIMRGDTAMVKTLIFLGADLQVSPSASPHIH